MTERVLTADWAVPANTVAGTTLRTGDFSDVPGTPCLLQQVHGNRVVEIGGADFAGTVVQADAVIGRQPGDVCVVKTADCLPVLVCSRDGSVIAAAHAGWRGLAAGIIEATIEKMGAAPDTLLAWLGPAISQPNFEVGEEVRDAFTNSHPDDTTHFEHNARGRWQADLYGLARARLARAGVPQVSGGGLCTFKDGTRFYSFRRDGETGRMFSFICRKA